MFTLPSCYVKRGLLFGAIIDELSERIGNVKKNSLFNEMHTNVFVFIDIAFLFKLLSADLSRNRRIFRSFGKRKMRPTTEIGKILNFFEFKILGIFSMSKQFSSCFYIIINRNKRMNVVHIKIWFYFIVSFTLKVFANLI